MKKETVKMRLWGLVIVPLMIIVFKNLYSLTNGALLGIFFGAVNGSYVGADQGCYAFLPCVESC